MIQYGQNESVKCHNVKLSIMNSLFEIFLYLELLYLRSVKELKSVHETPPLKNKPN
jgi:hypothetical protein